MPIKPFCISLSMANPAAQLRKALTSPRVLAKKNFRHTEPKRWILLTNECFYVFPAASQKNKGLKLTRYFQIQTLLSFVSAMILFSLLSSKGNGLHHGKVRRFGEQLLHLHILPAEFLLPSQGKCTFGRKLRLFGNMGALMYFSGTGKFPTGKWPYSSFKSISVEAAPAMYVFS